MERIFVHPEYKGTKGLDGGPDFALLKLATAAVGYAPIEGLDEYEWGEPSAAASGRLWLIGWGSMESLGGGDFQRPDELQDRLRLRMCRWLV